MKKYFVIFLAACLVSLMGCVAEGNLPTTPADAVVVDYDAPALAVSVSVGPELELTLSRTFEIIGVKPLNDDAERFVADLGLVGQKYENGMATILAAAEQQNYLKDAAGVTIAVEELVDGGWTILTQERLIKPVEQYQLSSGTACPCDVTPAGETLDADALQLRTKEESEEFVLEEYVDGAGNVKMQVYTYPNGMVFTKYPLDDSGNPYDQLIMITEYPDGRYGFELCENGKSSGYIEYPDGSRDTFVSTYETGYNEESQEYYRVELWSIYTYADGITSETFYENGVVNHESVTDEDGDKGEITYNEKDGSTSRVIYYSNGNTKSFQYDRPDGYHEKVSYNINGTIIYEFIDTGYERNEIHYDDNGQITYHLHRELSGMECAYTYENGELVFQATKHPDGSRDNITYGNGETIKYLEWIWPNGDYSQQYYDENGRPTSSVSVWEGVYSEIRFDETGAYVYEMQRGADGITHEWTYENGEVKSYTVTHPDGTVQHDEY